MAKDAQHLGGMSNKRGNRYEDFFVVARLIDGASNLLEKGISVRLKEQAQCPVDDLVLVDPHTTQYYQLKTSPGETWTKNNQRLRKQFIAQRQECQKRREHHRLYLVVPDRKRERLLREQIPKPVVTCAEVHFFPTLERPAQLADQRVGLAPAFDVLRPSRFPSRTADEAIVGEFFLAYANHVPDNDGWCVVTEVLASLQRDDQIRIRRPPGMAASGWTEADAILQRIDGLEWWTDRGWFEWRFRATDRGLGPPLNSESFRRFVDRIVSTRPETFADFERALP